MLIGVHLSIAGGALNVFKEAERLKINCFQLFLSSPQVWDVKRPSEEEQKTFRHLAGSYDFIVCHAPYLLNFASSDNRLFQKSIDRAVQDMSITAGLGIPYYVIHPGSADDAGEGIALIKKGLKTVFEKTENSVILIENTAGKRNDIGKNMDEIAEIISGFGDRAGVCLDTCHLFASGIDVKTGAGIEKFYALLKEKGLAEKVVMIHANDSKYPLGAWKDRHAHIGKGEIGEEGFFNLLHHPFFKKLPFILETPKEDGMDIINIRNLKTLYGRKKCLPHHD